VACAQRPATAAPPADYLGRLPCLQQPMDLKVTRHCDIDIKVNNPLFQRGSTNFEAAARLVYGQTSFYCLCLCNFTFQTYGSKWRNLHYL
jgi:hypothetical protein